MGPTISNAFLNLVYLLVKYIELYGANVLRAVSCAASQKQSVLIFHRSDHWS